MTDSAPNLPSPSRSFVIRPLLAICAIALTVLTWIAFAPSPSDLDVRFLDVGQGDCTLILPPGGGAILVDAGGRDGDFDAGRSRVLPALRHLGVGRIDLLVLTHSDSDHYGGAFEILDRHPVSALAVPDYRASDQDYLSLLAKAGRKKIPIHRLSRGQSLRLRDGAALDVLGPPAPPMPRWEHPDNNASLVLRLVFGRTSLLLMGDAEKEAEAALIANEARLLSDVLRAGHHGSNTSTTDKLLQRVRPRAAVISCGRNNPFGHPHPAVLDRLNRVAARTYRTDVNGPIKLVSDGKRIRLFVASRP